MDLLATATAAAEAGARVLDDWFRSGRLVADAKAKNDYVTQADREAERVIVDTILARHPDHRILSEEGTVNPGATADHEWVIDPLDGTTNFLRGLPIFSVSIACRLREEVVVAVVLDPEGDSRFTAERGSGAYWNGRRARVSERPTLDGAFLATGYPFRAHAALDLYVDLFRSIFARSGSIRRCGSAAIDLAHVAVGIYDGFFEFRLSPWDVAAGALLIEEAGGRISDLDGGRAFWRGGNVLAGAPGVHAELLAHAARAARESDIDRLVPLPGG